MPTLRRGVPRDGGLMQGARPGSGFALRRVAGVIALMLFARQVIAPLLIAADALRAAPTSMSSMGHGDHAMSHGMPENVPSPKHDSSCDHSMLGTGCCIASACSISFATGAAVLVVRTGSRVAAIGVTVENLLSPDIAPAVPPPRA